MLEAAPEYWLARFVFERALAAVYLIAFLNAANQFVPLLGERGLLPVPRFITLVPFRSTPSLFYVAPRDIAFRYAAWLGLGLAAFALSGLPQQSGTVWSAAVWMALWVIYLSFVNVGQTFYAFGWESLLLETGFLTIFAGGSETSPNLLILLMWRWVLFRVMFGAGLIKLRGDPCWRDLTCLHYYFETQPIPNPLSWYFHRLPSNVKRPFPDAAPRWIRAMFYEYHFSSPDERRTTRRWWRRREIGTYVAPSRLHVTEQPEAIAESRNDTIGGV